MRSLSSIINISFLLFALGCSSSFRIALADDGYFLESPKIVTTQNRFFLRWRYADKPLFAMYSASKIENGKLVFYIPVTTSTGSESRKLHFEEIKDPAKLLLVSENKVFWEDPDGSLKELKVEPMSADEFSSLKNLAQRRAH